MGVRKILRKLAHKHQSTELTREGISFGSHVKESIQYRLQKWPWRKETTSLEGMEVPRVSSEFEAVRSSPVCRSSESYALPMRGAKKHMVDNAVAKAAKKMGCLGQLNYERALKIDLANALARQQEIEEAERDADRDVLASIARMEAESNRRSVSSSLLPPFWNFEESSESQRMSSNGTTVQHLNQYDSWTENSQDFRHFLGPCEVSDIVDEDIEFLEDAKMIDMNDLEMVIPDERIHRELSVSHPNFLLNFLQANPDLLELVEPVCHNMIAKSNESLEETGIGEPGFFSDFLAKDTGSESDVEFEDAHEMLYDDTDRDPDFFTHFLQTDSVSDAGTNYENICAQFSDMDQSSDTIGLNTPSSFNFINDVKQRTSKMPTSDIFRPRTRPLVQIKLIRPSLIPRLARARII